MIFLNHLNPLNYWKQLVNSNKKINMIELNFFLKIKYFILQFNKLYQQYLYFISFGRFCKIY